MYSQYGDQGYEVQVEVWELRSCFSAWSRTMPNPSSVKSLQMTALSSKAWTLGWAWAWVRAWVRMWSPEELTASVAAASATALSVSAWASDDSAASNAAVAAAAMAAAAAAAAAAVAAAAVAAISPWSLTYSITAFTERNVGLPLGVPRGGSGAV